MPRLVVETLTPTPPQIAFDLARNLDLHQQSASPTNERTIAGRKSGLMELGEETTFEGKHFGVRLRHSAKITQFEPPHHFRDEMTRGAFAVFIHDHEFLAQENDTLIRDILEWRSPLGVLGLLADWIFLRAYLRNFLVKRGQFLAEVANRTNSEVG